MKTVTTGSTGTPLTVHRTGLEQFFFYATSLRDHHWYRFDMSGKLAVIRAFFGTHSTYPEGSRQENWGMPAGVIYPTGPCVQLDISTNLADQAEWLVRENPDYLLSHSTNLMFLARYFRAHGMALPRLKLVRGIGEIVDDAVRQACRDAWGVELRDIYSAVEAGNIALQCPEAQHLHVLAETVLLEVIDEQGAPTPPGEVGRVVITPLHNFAMPLLRYEQGDQAEVGAPCPCGRSLPVLNRIVGRRRNFIVTPNGNLRLGVFDATDLAEIKAVVQFQIVQTSVAELEVRLAVQRPLTPEEVQLVIDSTKLSLGSEFTITITYHDELPRSRGGKLTLVQSELSSLPPPSA